VREISARPDGTESSASNDADRTTITTARRPTMRVKEIMNTEVVSVTPDTPLRAVAELLVEHRFSGLPVCDESGQIVGVVSEADILRRERGTIERPRRLLGWLLEPSVAIDNQRALARTAGEAMTSPAITLEHYAPVAEAARLMIGHSINRLPVVNVRGALIGIVSRADLVRAFARPDAELEREIRDEVIGRSMWMDPMSVSAVVSAGDVVLTGEVDRKSEAETLALLTERVPGVLSVQSNVTYREDDTRG
jgi:CBS-domain-containing membrane protein